MPFWSDNFTAGGLQDPKRKFRFRVDFTGFGPGDSFLWWAKSAAKPSFAIGNADHKFLNHTFYYPGTVTWNDVDIVLVDPINPDMAASFSAMVEGGGYHPPANPLDLSTMTKASAASSAGQVTVTQIDAKGDGLEKWTLWNAWIAGVKYGDLAYGEDALTEITVTLKYDWAKLDVVSKGSVALSKGGTTFFPGPSAS